MDYKFNRDRIVRAAVKGVLETLPGGKATITATYDVEEILAGPTRDAAKIVAEVGSMDEEAVHFFDKSGDEVGWIHLVSDYGGNPGEVMCNWTTNLDEGMAKALDLSEHIMDRWDAQDI